MATVQFSTDLSLNLQGWIPGVPRQTLPDTGKYESYRFTDTPDMGARSLRTMAMAISRACS